jgi:hypothetical protein
MRKETAARGSAPHAGRRRCEAGVGRTFIAA